MNQNPRPLGECKDAESLAGLLGKSYQDLSKLIYGKKPLYREFSLAKKGGGQRTIFAPIKELRVIQLALKNLLQEYYHPRVIAHGFINERNIVSNASPHVSKKFVMNVDLEGFFPSINFGRVRSLFLSDAFGFTETVATIIAQICCYKNSLPAGAPTSPVISNMIAFRLDGDLRKLASTYRCTVTRYVDDITLSFNVSRKKLPEDIVFYKDNEFHIGRTIVSVIEGNGFKINEKKFRVQGFNQKQTVTGLVVNDFVNVDGKFISKTRAMIHALNKFGASNAQVEHLKLYKKKYIPEKAKLSMSKSGGDYFIKIIKGRLNYIKMVKGASSCLYRSLVYKFTCAVGNPDEYYKGSVIDAAARAVFVLEDYTGLTQGSCFNLSGIGLVTNQHVIPNVDIHTGINGNNCIVCNYLGDKLYPLITFIKSSAELDIAFISTGVHSKSIPELEANENFDYSVGSSVYALGYPNHAHGDNITRLNLKIIDRRDTPNDVRIKVDKNFAHGFSGGVVLDENAKVIGLVSNGNAAGSNTSFESSFIPITEVIRYFGEN